MASILYIVLIILGNKIKEKWGTETIYINNEGDTEIRDHIKNRALMWFLFLAFLLLSSIYGVFFGTFNF